MKALVLTGPQRVEMKDLPQPEPGPGEVLLRVAAAGICGSDVHGFLGHSPRRKPGLVLGHEAVATVADAHPTVADRESLLGRRVYVNPLISCGSCPACLSGRQNTCRSWRLLGMDRVHGAYADYVCVPAAQVLPVSDHVDACDAVLAEPLANLVHCFRVAVAEHPHAMAVFGAGTMGALMLMVARLRGVQRLFAVDRNAERLAVARELGAELTLNPDEGDVSARLRDATAGDGVDCCLDAVGAAATRQAAVASCRRGGRIMLLGLAENESSLPFVDMIRNEQSIATSFAYTPRDFLDSVRLIESGRVSLRRWSECRPLEEGQAAFMKMTHDPGATLKLVLNVMTNE
jgi:2-desacetyl-2-hydroxyethyl bacteriochlorophyllide A dehydrogenase